MKRALVFSGGGSRGAYECGAWKALTELGQRFDAYCGVSIGGINAAMAAQGDVDKAVRLWKEITVERVIEGKGSDFVVDLSRFGKRDILPFLKDKLMVNPAPLEELLRQSIDEKAVRGSGKELGLLVTCFPQMTPRELTLNGMDEGSLHDWLMASASCFPVFPARVVRGESYVDGGFCDNMPVSMALRGGAEEIVSVDVHPKFTHPELMRLPQMKLIHPLHELGGILNFDRRLLSRSFLLGYHDTLKAYGRLDGIRYSFRKVNELKAMPLAYAYIRAVSAFDAECTDAPLLGALNAETPLRTLSCKESLLRGLELAAETLGFREDAVYDADVLTERILTHALAAGREAVPAGYALEEAAAKGKGAYLSALCCAMLKDAGFSGHMRGKLRETPKETAAAMMLALAAKERGITI